MRSTREDYRADALPLHWNHLCNPVEGAVSLTANPGRLTLACNEAAFPAMQRVTWLGRRRQHVWVRVAASGDFALYATARGRTSSNAATVDGR